MSWDFSKLPKEEHAGAVEAYRQRNFIVLLQIHNKYQLSSFGYKETDLKKCCSDTHTGLINHFEDAIKKGHITTTP